MKPGRRWFRYSLRTFFILLSAVGVWLGMQVKWKRDRQDFFRERHLEIKEVGGGGIIRAPFSLRLVGESGRKDIAIFFQKRSTDAQRQAVLQRVRLLFPEAVVSFEVSPDD